MASALKTWVIDTSVRAVKTSAQTLASMFGASALNILHGVDWKADLGIALGAGLASLLHNLQTIPVGSAAPAKPDLLPELPASVLSPEDPRDPAA